MGVIKIFSRAIDGDVINPMVDLSDGDAINLHFHVFLAETLSVKNADVTHY